MQLKFYTISSSKGFTLAEIVIVLGILGILIVALFPSYTNYIARGRDTARVTDIDQLLKIHSTYFSDKERYPDHDLGCVNWNDSALMNAAGKRVRDPLSSHNNGCNTNGEYGYASGSFALTPHVYLLVAIMEQQQGGNYAGPITNLTGSISDNPTEYNNALTLTSKGAGPYYVRIP